MRAAILAAVAGAALLGAASVAAQETTFFRIGTAGTGGIYYPLGGLMADAISAPVGSKPCDQGGSCGVPGLVASAIATEGSVANAAAIQDGRLESGFVQGDVAAWAFRGSAPWTAAPATKLRAIANLYPETMHLVATEASAIATIADLRGRSVSLDEQDSGTRIDAELVLGAAGLKDTDLQAQYLSVSEASDAMQQGTLEAFFFMGGYPAPAISELASQVPIRIVPIDGPLAQTILATYPFFSPGVLPTESYQGQENPVPTLTVGAQWLTSSDQPEPLIYAVTAALWNERTGQRMAAGPARGRTIQRDAALNGITIPLHPGAERFYREIGILP